MTPIRIVAGAVEIREFELLRLDRSIFAAAGAFELTIPYRKSTPFWVGARVEIWWGADELMLLGFVDQVEIGLHVGAHLMTVRGRDIAQDLVDCSGASDAPKQMVGVTLRELAEAVAEPFVIPVVIDDGVPEGDRFESFVIETGESCFNVIDRAAKMRGKLVYTESGDLLITEPGIATLDVALVEAVNLKSWKIVASNQNRFSDYRVVGQKPGEDWSFGAEASEPGGSATDPGISRHRPLVLLAEGPVSDAEADLRAQWEATVRAAQSSRVSVIVRGWDQSRTITSAGKLWPLNRIASLKIPTHDIDSKMLIEALTFEATNDGGLQTSIELVRPDAYSPAPAVALSPDPFKALLQAAGEAESDESPQ